MLEKENGRDITKTKTVPHQTGGVGGTREDYLSI